MKIYLAKYEPGRIGGGWTFANNFVKGMGDSISNYDEADIYFIMSASMVQRKEVDKAKAYGKKIVLRVDNAIRNSRNRNTGMTRMKDFYNLADLVIFQSQWAKNFLEPFLIPTYTDIPIPTKVILNGVDKDKFYSHNKGSDDSYLYVRSSRDEGKQWIMAWYWFVNNKGTLEIVGKFSPDNLEYNFDFYNHERFRFMGEQQNMSDVYRRNKYFLYTYLNDACSNTLLEARASGCEIIDVFGMLQTGGAPEIMACEDIGLERMCKEYEEVMNVLV